VLGEILVDVAGGVQDGRPALQNVGSREVGFASGHFGVNPYQVQQVEDRTGEAGQAVARLGETATEA